MSTGSKFERNLPAPILDREFQHLGAGPIANYPAPRPMDH
jgi:hypothetical protein